MLYKDYVKQIKGFTMIELMITIAIIGLLAAIAIPNYISYRDNGYCSQAETDANSVGSAITDYYSIPTRTGLPTLEDLGVKTLNPVVITGSPNETIVVTVHDRTGRCPKDYETPNERWDESTDTFTKYIR